MGYNTEDVDLQIKVYERHIDKIKWGRGGDSFKLTVHLCLPDGISKSPDCSSNKVDS